MGGVDEEANNYSDESLGEQCNNTSDCEQPNTEGSINNTDSDGEQPNIAIEGEHPMEENADAASTLAENAESRANTESTPIEVYGGSQCRPSRKPIWLNQRWQDQDHPGKDGHC